MDGDIASNDNFVVNLGMTVGDAIAKGHIIPGSGIALCYAQNKTCGEASADACGVKKGEHNSYDVYFAPNGLLCDDENECYCPPVANNTKNIWADGYIGGPFGGAVGRYRLVAARDVATQVAHVANPYLSAAVNAADLEVSFGSEAMTL